MKVFINFGVWEWRDQPLVDQHPKRLQTCLEGLTRESTVQEMLTALFAPGEVPNVEVRDSWDVFDKSRTISELSDAENAEGDLIIDYIQLIPVGAANNPFAARATNNWNVDTAHDLKNSYDFVNDLAVKGGPDRKTVTSQVHWMLTYTNYADALAEMPQNVWQKLGVPVMCYTRCRFGPGVRRPANEPAISNVAPISLMSSDGPANLFAQFSKSYGINRTRAIFDTTRFAHYIDPTLTIAHLITTPLTWATWNPSVESDPYPVDFPGWTEYFRLQNEAAGN